MPILRRSAVALCLAACGASSPHAPLAADCASPAGATCEQVSPCSHVYLFQFRVTRADGQVERTGGTLLRARSCLDEIAVPDAPGGSERYRAQVDTASPGAVTFDIFLSGEHIRTRVPVNDGVRVVLGDVLRSDRSANVFVTVTPFCSMEDMRRRLEAPIVRGL